MMDCGKGTKQAHDGFEVNKSEEYEEKLLSTVGLERVQHYEIYDTFFNLGGGEVGHIHQIETGYENPDVLVMIHGYGSAGIFYYKMIAELRHKFHIYAIDMYGMGSSARPGLKSFEFDNVVNFFVDSLEAWRIKQNLSNFVLMAHSMGGYISSQWVRLKNPPIRHLYLLSPAGFTNKDDATLKKDAGLLKRPLMLMYDLYLHKYNGNPFKLMIFKDFFMKQNFKNRLGLPPKEAEYAAGYLSSTLDKDECGERAVGVLLRYAKYSTYPISQILDEIKKSSGLKFPIVVLYGKDDWMDHKHSIEVNQVLRLGVDIDFIPSCGHQIILQNPKGLAERVLFDLYKGYDQITKVKNI